MGKRGKSQSPCGKGASTYWQSDDLNRRYSSYFAKCLMRLALARFRWVNLPESCDARYLEWQLLMNGIATIARPASADVFVSLQCVPEGINMYGTPPSWRCVGDNGTNFHADNSTGVVIYDNMMRAPVIGDIRLISNELADIIRTKQVNRMHLKTPYILTGEQQYRDQMANVYKQIAGNEPAIIGTRALAEDINIDAIDTHVEFIGDKLQEDLQATLNLALSMLGVAEMPFKKERQTSEEVDTYNEATNILRSDPLSTRRQACDAFNARFMPEKPLMCVWREDFESTAYNFSHNMQEQVRLA